MKVLECTTPGQMSYKIADKPSLSAGESLLKILKIGVCGTDINAIAGVQPYFSYPRILGHEIAAQYVQGDASNITQGDLVTVIPYMTKGLDIASRMGKPNCATDMQVLGVHVDGALSEYIVVPSQTVISGQGLQTDELVLVEPLAIGAHAIQRAAIQQGEYTLVIGAGTIGLGIINLAHLAGAKIIAMDVDQARLEQAKKLGAQHIINPLQDDVVQSLLDFTAADMPTVIFDASGNRTAINEAFQYMAHGARYILVGIQSQELVISHPEFHKREGTLMSSRNALKSDFDNIIQKFKNKTLRPTDYITKRISFDEAGDFLMQNKEQLKQSIKTVIEFDAES